MTGGDSLRDVARAYVPMLLVLGAIWGASFLFINVGLRAFHPATLMAFRLVLAASILLPVLILRMGAREALSALGKEGAGLVLGVIAAALPFTLIAWGQTHVDSGIAAIANASMPIFVVLLAFRFRPSERAGGLRLAGVVLGLVGVAVLAGAQPKGGWWGVLRTLAVVLAAFSYAVGSLYAQHRLGAASGPVIATAQCIAGALFLLPFGLAQLPSHGPGWKPLASVLALGIAGTAFATLLYYRIVFLYGSSRASLVVYLLPPFAVFYGATLLGESLTVEELIGMVLVLGGVALGSGAVRLARGRAAAPAPP